MGHDQASSKGQPQERQLTSLRLYGREPTSVFALLGSDENSATFALGWALARCTQLRSTFLADVAELHDGVDGFAVELQRHTSSGGFTDIELFCAEIGHVVVEAKRGWELPTTDQLQRYAVRLSPSSGSRIVSLSAASQEFATRRLPNVVGSTQVIHRSWADVSELVRKALASTKRLEERLWLSELAKHLKEYVVMQDPRDNLVYVVSLSCEAISGASSYSWLDVVEKDHSYCHPFGDHWPTIPPNYMGFRYDGQLQSVHHIDRFEILADLTQRNPNWRGSPQDHFVYTLGPPMRPARVMRTGKIIRAQRVWCAIDTLLSGAFDTISDARDETKRRLDVASSSPSP